ncbi:condensation domain-containing protein [Paenibacillus sp. FSL M7-0420]|uniref:condensation domain-containing protein n=1 Tax=Paenibacillus sp. FSL M7-0420 TaxID=2921609 RepID=UPI004040A31E
MPFDLYEEFLYHFSIFKLGDGHYAYYIKFHHSISDGWSLKLLTEQINNYYNDFRNNSDSAYEDNDSYIHLLENETKYSLSERAMSDKKFWVDRYQDFLEAYTG